MYMTFNQLREEQEKPLDYKIDRAVEALICGFSVSKHTTALAFSGGKDSTVLWDLIRRFLADAKYAGLKTWVRNKRFSSPTFRLMNHRLTSGRSLTVISQMMWFAVCTFRVLGQMERRFWDDS